MKTQLLCTFTQKENLNDILDLIILCNDILYDKIYVFQNGKDHNQLICTYNVEYDGDNHPEDIPRRQKWIKDHCVGWDWFFKHVGKPTHNK